jgi:hypothetical protein
VGVLDGFGFSGSNGSKGNTHGGINSDAVVEQCANDQLDGSALWRSEHCSGVKLGSLADVGTIGGLIPSMGASLGLVRV